VDRSEHACRGGNLTGDNYGAECVEGANVLGSRISYQSQNIIAATDQLFADIRPKKTRSSGEENCFHGFLRLRRDPTINSLFLSSFLHNPMDGKHYAHTIHPNASNLTPLKKTQR
jgi:hypothetical protein